MASAETDMSLSIIPKRLVMIANTCMYPECGSIDTREVHIGANFGIITCQKHYPNAKRDVRKYCQDRNIFLIKNKADFPELLDLFKIIMSNFKVINDDNTVANKVFISSSGKIFKKDNKWYIEVIVNDLLFNFEIEKFKDDRLEYNKNPEFNSLIDNIIKRLDDGVYEDCKNVNSVNFNTYLPDVLYFESEDGRVLKLFAPGVTVDSPAYASYVEMAKTIFYSKQPQTLADHVNLK